MTTQPLSGVAQFLTLPLPPSVKPKEIPLSPGFVALVDEADYEWLSRTSWTMSGGYATRSVASSDAPCGRANLRMHRVIMGLSMDDACDVDHIDGNKLNNQRSNLRLATRAQNKHNEKLRANNTSGYKGVCWHSIGKKWRAAIRVPGKRIHLGLFNTPEEAHEAYKAAASRLHGEFANFG